MTVAGKYLVKEILGEGGMGVVYGGIHTLTDRDVALKILHPQHAANPDIVRRFFQEAKAAARIEHAHVVGVLDMGQDEDGSAYLVMERLRGAPLGHHLKKRGTFPPEEAVEILEPVMDALSAAHRVGVVHRDLKPENIFLAHVPGRGTVPKLLDFGIAKIIGDTSGHTDTGAAIGTPWYMSPEQVLGERDLGPPADVWSIAILLYEAVAGERPFPAATATAVFAMIVGGAPRPLASVAPDLSPEFCAVVDSALVNDAAMRPTMDPLADRLVAAVGRERRRIEPLSAVAPSGELFLDSDGHTSMTPLPEHLASAASAHLSARASQANTALLDDSGVLGGDSSSASGELDYVPTGIPSVEEGATPMSFAEAPMEPRRSSQLPWIAAAVGVLALGSGLVFLLLFLILKEDPPDPAVVSLPTRGEVTESAGAAPGAGDEENSSASVPTGEPSTTGAQGEENSVGEVAPARTGAGADPPPHAEGSATLELRSTPESEIFVDGMAVGRTPQTLALAPGQHRIRLRDPSGGAERSFPVDLEAGTTTSRRINLAPRGHARRGNPWVVGAD